MACLTSQQFICGPSHPYTTADVFQSNDNSSSPYACQEYCRDGCCYLFDPSQRTDLTDKYGIAAWVIIAFFVILGILETIAVLRVFPKARKESPNNNSISERRVVGAVMSTNLAVGFSFAVSLFLYELYKGKDNSGQSLSWQFPPEDAAIVGFVLSSFVALLSTAFTLHKMLAMPKDVNLNAYASSLNNASNASTSLVALVAVCLVPLVGGWDGVSGLAFKDKPTYAQTFEQNVVRYNNIVAQQSALLGIAVSFVTQSLFGVAFQLVF